MGKMNINKISSSNAISVERQKDVKATTKDIGSPVHHKKMAVGDKLEFSARASEVGNLVDQIKQLPDVREEKVNSLRNQISAGSYNPSSQDIAAAILKDEKA